MNTIRELVNQGIKVLQRMKINYNSTIGPNTMQLINISKQLIPNLQKKSSQRSQIFLNNAFLPLILMDSFQHIPSEISELVIGF